MHICSRLEHLKTAHVFRRQTKTCTGRNIPPRRAMECICITWVRWCFYVCTCSGAGWVRAGARSTGWDRQWILERVASVIVYEIDNPKSNRLKIKGILPTRSSTSLLFGRPQDGESRLYSQETLRLTDCLHSIDIRRETCSLLQKIASFGIGDDDGRSFMLSCCKHKTIVSLNVSGHTIETKKENRFILWDIYVKSIAFTFSDRRWKKESIITLGSYVRYFNNEPRRMCLIRYRGLTDEKQIIGVLSNFSSFKPFQPSVTVIFLHALSSKGM